MLINQLFANFHSFLIAAWPNISQVLGQLDWDESPYFLDDWMQANWELLVEKQLLKSGQLLVPYGYDSSSRSRYTCQNEELTHRVQCRRKEGLECQYNFLCFVSKVDGAYVNQPPFDLVGLEDIGSGDRLNLALDEVDFFVETIK